jgi:hypothetical protein
MMKGRVIYQSVQDGQEIVDDVRDDGMLNNSNDEEAQVAYKKARVQQDLQDIDDEENGKGSFFQAMKAKYENFKSNRAVERGHKEMLNAKYDTKLKQLKAKRRTLEHEARLAAIEAKMQRDYEAKMAYASASPEQRSAIRDQKMQKLGAMFSLGGESTSFDQKMNRLLGNTGKSGKNLGGMTGVGMMGGKNLTGFASMGNTFSGTQSKVNAMMGVSSNKHVKAPKSARRNPASALKNNFNFGGKASLMKMGGGGFSKKRLKKFL